MASHLPYVSHTGRLTTDNAAVENAIWSKMQDAGVENAGVGAAAPTPWGKGERAPPSPTFTNGWAQRAP